MYCLNMLRMALELASKVNMLYEDIANKFFEHFLYIAHAINGIGGGGLWDQDDEFFYDRLNLQDGQSIPMRVRSAVGIIPLFAVDTMESALLESLPGFQKRVNWFIANRPDLCQNLAPLMRHGVEERHLLSLVGAGRLRCVLRVWVCRTDREVPEHEPELFSHPFLDLLDDRVGLPAVGALIVAVLHEGHRRIRRPLDVIPLLRHRQDQA